MEPRPRRWHPWIAVTMSVLALVGDSACRRVEPQPQHSDDAMYAAEAGLEFAKDELARVCGNPQALAELRKVAESSFVPLPGLKEPIAQIYGYKLPGGATASITLRVPETAPRDFVLRSLGRSPTEEKTVEAEASCQLVEPRKRRS